MQAAEEATGKSAQQLYKMMEQGQLMAKDFLVPFAKAMRRIVRENDALEKATEKLTSQQNRLKTAYKELVNDVFQNGGAKGLGNLFKELTKFIEDNKEELQGLLKVSIDTVVGLTKMAVAVVDLGKGILDTTASIVTLGNSTDGVSFLVGVFYDFLAVIHKVTAALHIVKDLVTLNFDDLNKFYEHSDTAMAKAARLQRDENMETLFAQVKQKAPVTIQKVELTSYNSDPKQTNNEFMNGLEDTLSNILGSY